MDPFSSNNNINEGKTTLTVAKPRRVEHRRRRVTSATSATAVSPNAMFYENSTSDQPRLHRVFSFHAHDLRPDLSTEDDKCNCDSPETLCTAASSPTSSSVDVLARRLLPSDDESNQSSDGLLPRPCGSDDYL